MEELIKYLYLIIDIDINLASKICDESIVKDQQISKYIEAKKMIVTKGEYSKMLEYNKIYINDTYTRSDLLCYQDLIKYYKEKNMFCELRSLYINMVKNGNMINSKQMKETKLDIGSLKRDGFFNLSMITKDEKERSFYFENLLLMDHDLYSDELKNRLYNYYPSSVKSLKWLDKKRIIFPTPFIKEGYSERYFLTNPSIYRDVKNQEYMLIVRGVNYTHINSVYTIYDPDNYTLRSKNYLVTIDSRYQIVSILEIKDVVDKIRYKRPYQQIYGPEDCRIIGPIDSSNKIYFTCTVLDDNPNGLTEIGLCTIDLDEVPDCEQSVCDETLYIGYSDQINPNHDGSYEQIYINTMKVLKSPNSGRYEKNWIPFLSKDKSENKLDCVYSYDPTIILSNINDVHPSETHNCFNQYTIIKKDNIYPICMKRFRGSSKLIPFRHNKQDGYLTIVHESIKRPSDGLYCYFHRFVWINDMINMKIKYISKNFIFRQLGPEFCAGIEYDLLDKNKILISLGINDAEAWIYMIHVDHISSELFELEYFSKF